MTRDCSTAEVAQLTREDMRQILKRHYGVQAEIARELGISSAAVLNWTKGKCESLRIADAVESKCLKLL